MIPNISIVIATHNGAQYIGELLDSLLQQTLPFYELVVSDDGSTDSTVDIVCQYQHKDNRIKIFQHVNKCMNKEYTHELVKDNFLFGFSKTSGEIIAPADQDDIWLPNKLESLVHYINEDVDLVNAQDYLMYEDGTYRYDNWQMSDLTDTIWYHGLKGHTCIFKRELLELYSHAPLVSWDYVLAMYCCITRRYITIPDALVFWRRHADAVTYVKERDFKQCAEHKVSYDSPRGDKRTKISYVNRMLMNKYRHPLLSEYFLGRVELMRFIESNCKIAVDKDVLRCCMKTLLMCSKQTVFSFIFAGLYSVMSFLHLGIYRKTIKRIVVGILDAFSRPYVFLYTQRDCKQLF